MKGGMAAVYVYVGVLALLALDGVISLVLYSIGMSMTICHQQMYYIYFGYPVYYQSLSLKLVASQPSVRCTQSFIHI